MTDPDDFDSLVRAWTGYAERWAYRQERRCPGEDWWPVAGRALWKAAATFEPERGVTFLTWLKANIRNEMPGVMQRWRRRAARRPARLPPDVPDPGPCEATGDPRPPRPSAALEALDALPARQAESIRRHHIGGETHTDIARDMGVVRQTVSAAIACGLARLRIALT